MNKERIDKSSESKRPNIIFFFSDQQRWDTVGVYGQKLPVTPHLDQMAAEGVMFNQAFTCQPVCGPARACLQTGLYAAENGSYQNGIPLNQEVPLLADLLNQADYETAYVGKWHLASGGENNISSTDPVPKSLRGGYKDWWIASDILEYTSHGYGGYMYDSANQIRKFEHYRADATTDYAIEYLEQKTSDKPFFMMVSYIEPHHQNDRNIYEGPKGSKEKFKNYDVPGDLVGTQGDWKDNYPDYLGCCNSLDKNLGRIRDYLKAKDLTKNTVIFYASDHGSHFRTRNDEYKRSCHDGCIRIPMIAYGPGFQGGKKVESLVSLIDLPKTFLATANIDAPEKWQGNPLNELLQSENKKDDNGEKIWPEEVFLQISESQVGRAIRTKKWKYSVWAPDKKNTNRVASDIYEESFLYDLESDPHERNNLINDFSYKDVKEKLKKLLLRRMVEAREDIPQIIEASYP